MNALAWYDGTTLDRRKVQAANVDLDRGEELYDGRFIGRRFTVARHGEGRKYWGVTYPDGTYTHNALTQAEAKKQAETWRPDSTAVQLVDHMSQDADATPAAASSPSATADFTAAAVVSAIVDRAQDGAQLPRRGWGYQDAGEKQQHALNAIRELAELRRAVEDAIRTQVSVARVNTGNAWYSNAATWQHIGDALGVTKQSAQRKYGGAG